MSARDRLFECLDEVIFRVFGHQIARRFVVFGGVPAVLSQGAMLRQEGIVPTYNRIDEHVQTTGHLEHVLSSYITLVQQMDDTNRGNIAIKPSSLGIELGQRMFVKSLARLANTIGSRKIEIEVDAESRETLRPVQQALNTLEPYLPRGVSFRPAFQMHLPVALRRELIEQDHILDMPVRIVKGSGLYNINEPEVDKETLLALYLETFVTEVLGEKHPVAATVHDKELLLALTDAMDSQGVARERYGIQLLSGPFGRSLMKRYAKNGYRVGCYLAFVEPEMPDAWKGYVRRRIAFGRKLFFGLA